LIKNLSSAQAVDCRVVPFSKSLSGLVVAADLRTTINTDNIERIRFVLNRPITCLHANEEAIFKAIERDYQDAL
jgi:hypothetical protein